ncbi:FkbM family methyltransferase [Stieleria sp. ICT_E10.1]|uniref:FkbM family methyltransferase n=1 Tax=Stieleria sedimenti TaxID=2976331 RepID=UPI00217F38DD|nr:FkbM family methyltransferase [Stieleria sedimenti]MCS7469418.1 FkbM family methyltransferase [Stieleria sedimenti]
MKSRDQYVQEDLKNASLLNAVFAHAPPATIFDIGACEGLDSIRYSRLFPQATIYAFEPLPENVAMIDDSIRRFDGQRVKVVNVALASSNGKATFHVSGGCPEGRQHETGDWTFGNKSSSLIAPNQDEIKRHWPWLQFEGTTDVDTMTMDDFCERENVMPDFLHMDVQGAELDVLRGAEKSFGSIRAIWMEVSLTEVYAGQPLVEDVRQFMSGHGMFESVMLPEGPQADVLYVKKQLADLVPAEVIAELKSQCVEAQKPRCESIAKPGILHRVVNRLFH